MQNLENVIRERAYHLWLADGCPNGKCEGFWLDAQRDVLADSIAAAMSATAPKTKAKASAKKVASKPAAKKRRAA